MVSLADIEPKRLRSRFLDAHVRETPPATLDVVAHMLFELDRAHRAIDLGLGHVADLLGVGRVDLSFGTAADHRLAPVRQVCRGGEWPSLVGVALPNQHAVLQRVWRRPGPVPYDDVAANPALGDLQGAFLATGARGMLAQRLAGDGGPFAIVCADAMEGSGRWSDAQKERLSRFTRTFLGPILALQRDLSARADRPSPAELQAVRLAAEGLSYKEIAAALGKSVRTIESQLRSARGKTGAANQAELVLRCRPWL